MIIGKESLKEIHKRKDVLSLINRKMLIHKQLEKPSRTYVVYSDLHGSYEKFIHWLKNGLGYFKIAVREGLERFYSPKILQIYECLLFLANKSQIELLEKYVEGTSRVYDEHEIFGRSVSRKFISYIFELEEIGLSKKRILEDILILLRETTRGDERRITKSVPEEHIEVIFKLYLKSDNESYEALLDGLASQERIFLIYVSLLVKLVVANMFDKHINLGDTYDRGDSADKLVKVYRTFFNQSAPGGTLLHYIWGNHDILWMGARGNPILVVTALRISMRYNNLDFLRRYGFDLTKLKNYANKCFTEKPTGNYIKASNFSSISEDEACKMTKVLFVLEAKLTVLLLKKLQHEQVDYSDFKKDLAHYEGLLRLLPVNKSEDPSLLKEHRKENTLLLDFFFPTLDKDCPEKLTEEENDLVNELVFQFVHSEKLQVDTQWMLRNGEIYRVVDKTLYFHAAIPSTENKELDKVHGRKGKELLDFVQYKMQQIGNNWRRAKKLALSEQMYFWYLWCGHNSPFFCKNKMATLERTVFDKHEAAKSPLTTHQEVPNPFYRNIRDDQFLERVLKEFIAEKVVMGHTPVKTLQQTVLSANIHAFCVDGGVSHAYGDRGAVLINTPEKNYLIFQPPLQEMVNAENQDQIPDIEVITLEAKKNFRLKDMDKGYFLKEELKIIDEILKESLEHFGKEYFT